MPSGGSDLKSGIETSESCAAPTMGISFSSGDSVTRILPLMMRRCMHTCTDTVRILSPSGAAATSLQQRNRRGVCIIYLTLHMLPWSMQALL